MNIVKQNTDYALRAMIDLAANYKDKAAVSVRTIAVREDISYQFACKILQKLQGAGLVQSSMGPKGGYSLAKPPKRINLLEVLSAMQGPLSVNSCVIGPKGCPRTKACAASKKMNELQKYMEKFMADVTLDQFLKDCQSKKRGK
jgi:Rrf2 family transcriptional regulator, iron-sulfur cluster assembly transcription factor